MDIDSRMWNIEDTHNIALRPFIKSTRMLDGLRELGIVPPIVLEVLR